MEILRQRILKDGQALSEDVLKVDSFLNHQVDAKLMYEIGKCFAEHFKNKNITRVFTIESSGISPAVMTALQMNIPMVTLKKQKPNTLIEEFYQTTVHSFTKNSDYSLTLSKKFISSKDNILIIDDFLANGEAALGTARIIEEAGAKVSGIGIVIEKSFQKGNAKLVAKGYELYSLARIAKMKKGFIEFI